MAEKCFRVFRARVWPIIVPTMARKINMSQSVPGIGDLGIRKGANSIEDVISWPCITVFPPRLSVRGLLRMFLIERHRAELRPRRMPVEMGSPSLISGARK